MTSSAECMDAEISNAVVPEDMCSWYQQKLEDFDDKCIILIQLFGGYSISEVSHAKVSCARNTREFLHAKITRRMHGVACRMQRHSFLVEREC